MVGIVVVVALTFVLSLALLLLLLSGNSPVAARLTELAAERGAELPSPTPRRLASRWHLGCATGSRHCAEWWGWQTMVRWPAAWLQPDIATPSTWKCITP